MLPERHSLPRNVLEILRQSSLAVCVSSGDQRALRYSDSEELSVQAGEFRKESIQFLEFQPF